MNASRQTYCVRNVCLFFWNLISVLSSHSSNSTEISLCPLGDFLLPFPKLHLISGAWGIRSVPGLRSPFVHAAIHCDDWHQECKNPLSPQLPPGPHTQYPSTTHSHFSSLLHLLIWESTDLAGAAVVPSFHLTFEWLKEKGRGRAFFRGYVSIYILTSFLTCLLPHNWEIFV